MAGFLAFVEGNVPTFPRRKMKKMTFSYQMIDHERYLSFLINRVRYHEWTS